MWQYGNCFSLEYLFSLGSIIPPMLHTHPHPNSTLITTDKCLGTFKANSAYSDIRKNSTEKCFHAHSFSVFNVQILSVIPNKYVPTSCKRFSSERSCNGQTRMVIVQVWCREAWWRLWINLSGLYLKTYIGFSMDYYQCTTHSLSKLNNTELRSTWLHPQRMVSE
jgi:hypothetical protein